MINTRKQAMALARGTTRNVPGMCQAVTRGWFNAPSVGDVDGDGDADAVDGWKSEPVWARHVGDRTPPAGVPLAWSGGANGFGHRAISMGNGFVRSTDAGGKGITKTVPFEWFAQNWSSLHYLGWTETIDGHLIPTEKADPVKIPVKPIVKVAPRLARRVWRGFVHLKARFYQDYEKAIHRASKRKLKHKRSIDIDNVPDKNHVFWGLHWKTVGKNKLHDPQGKIKASAKIGDLTTAEVRRLRGPKGQRPRRMLYLLRLAARLGVRVEVEVKVKVRRKKLARLLSKPEIRRMDQRGDLQFKTLAALPGSLNRLRPVHAVGGTTMLSFTGYRGKGLDKQRAYRVTDFIRGNPKWK